MTDNLRIWSVFEKTNPDDTKSFTRGGGFKGTAISPISSIKRMTEQFGPCGTGWGMYDPTFQVVPAAAEVMVFCTVGIWFRDAGAQSQTVYGVGGDKVMTQIFEKDPKENKEGDLETGRFKTYPQASDEAFKSAYTDALTNAFKMLGIGADVHEGKFDNNKYVHDLKEEFSRPEVTRFQKQAKASLVREGVHFDPNEFEEAPIEAYEEPRQKAIQAVQKAPVKREGGMISEGQVKRLWAIAKQAGKDKGEVMKIVSEQGYETVEEISWKKYNAIIDAIQAPF